MRDSTSEIDGDKMEEVRNERNTKTEALKTATKSLEEARKSCWLNIACDIESKESEVSKALSESSAANLRVETLEFQFGAKSQMKGQIDTVLKNLYDEQHNLERDLEQSLPSPSSSLVEDMGRIEPFQPQEIQDNWAMFDFSSTSSSKEASSHSFQTDTSASAGYAFVASASVSTSTGYQSFSEHVKSANIKVKAKLLKVKINRPWFNSDLFTNREFKLVRELNW